MYILTHNNYINKHKRFSFFKKKINQKSSITYSILYHCWGSKDLNICKCWKLRDPGVFDTAENNKFWLGQLPYVTSGETGRRESMKYGKKKKRGRKKNYNLHRNVVQGSMFGMVIFFPCKITFGFIYTNKQPVYLCPSVSSYNRRNVFSSYFLILVIIVDMFSPLSF